MHIYYIENQHQHRNVICSRFISKALFNLNYSWCALLELCNSYYMDLYYLTVERVHVYTYMADKCFVEKHEILNLLNIYLIIHTFHVIMINLNDQYF